jgi:predicted  nucleic acid-binding Zn-ribbon protein
MTKTPLPKDLEDKLKLAEETSGTGYDLYKAISDKEAEIRSLQEELMTAHQKIEDIRKLISEAGFLLRAALQNIDEPPAKQ